MQIKLSYVLTTFNKLAYLNEVIGDLVENCGPDEEIIVTDGRSTDGSVELLEKFLAEGKIHKLVSERDLGEAHGFNKGTLLARGELIKYISDDDIFFYEKIREQRDFMLQHPEIDMVGTNGWTVHLKDVVKGPVIATAENSAWFNERVDDYIQNGKPFPFTGLGLMIRTKSIASAGLFSTGAVWVDYEFGLRVTSNKKLTIGWWDSFCYVRLQNVDSNSVKYYSTMIEETRSLDDYYRAISRKAVTPGTLPSIRLKGKQLLIECYWLTRRMFKKNSGSTVLASVSSNNQEGDNLSIGEKISIIRNYSRDLRKPGGVFKWRAPK
jgi:glycosyltransferase involved in cell wall biosynthesis